MVEDRMEWTRSILWILVSTLFISGSAFMAWLYFLHAREKRLHDDQYRLVAIVQSTAQADALKTVYLAEMLGLSLDQPVNLYQFNTQKAVQNLSSHPLIKNVTVKKILPGTLYIDYSMRVPVAYVGDFLNTVVDEEGFLFSFYPFFTPKHLPIFYLGLEKEEYLKKQNLKENPSLVLAFSILKNFDQLQQDEIVLKQLDVTQAKADSYGQRQVVLKLEETALKKSGSSFSTIFLRLNSENINQNLTNFYTLYQNLPDDKKEKQKETPVMTVDLRIPHLAFIKKDS